MFSTNREVNDGRTKLTNDGLENYVGECINQLSIKIQYNSKSGHILFWMFISSEREKNRLIKPDTLFEREASKNLRRNFVILSCLAGRQQKLCGDPVEKNNDLKPI